MCLLVVLSRVHPDAPLVLAANRDEWLARPATPMVVHRASDPRIIGGRDDERGGTWLAVNEYGVLAALTNRPSAAGRDPARHSRGEIPLALARHRTAREAALSVAQSIRAEDYNGCWVLVADRTSAFYFDVHGVGAPVVNELPPGIHVLENNPLEPRSPKASMVHAALEHSAIWRGETLVKELWRVLGSHAVPALSGRPTRVDDGAPRPAVTHAACVHAGPYGTRWSAVVRVLASPDAPPDVRYAEGAPCVSQPASAARFFRDDADA